MSLLATEPASIAKVLDASIKLYVASFRKLTGIFLILAVLYIVMGLLSLKLQPDPSASPNEAMELLQENLAVTLTAIVLISLASFILYAAIIYRLDNIANDREDSLSEAVAAGLKAFPTVLFAAILYIIAVMLGCLALLIPGLILMLSLAFYIYFIVIESYGGYSALKASHSLVWGHWWRTTAVFTVPMVLWIAVAFTFGFLMAFLAIDNKPLLQISMNLLSVIFTPYLFALGYVQFQDLKLRKSGSDLAARLAR
jgi:glucan phosphoethanolaminetransferase (alkaline phosphatase superfamily)